MEKYAKRLQDIINEQDFCLEPEEIRTVEKALGVLKKYSWLVSVLSKLLREQQEKVSTH